MSSRAEAHNWVQMSDKDLESAASYYMWLAKTFPDLPNHRLQEIVAEAMRRRKPEILSRAKTSMHREQTDG